MEEFFGLLATAEQAALLLDFDGTLAPFRVDPSKSHPWAGVSQRLDEIQKTRRTYLAIVTGRPASDVAQLLGMKTIPEIWGLHGAQRLNATGQLEQEPLSAGQQAVIRDARAVIRGAGMHWRIEEKPNAVAVHWRGESQRHVQSLKLKAHGLLQPFAEGAGVKLLTFDGGLELRAGRNKGDAVRLILQELPVGVPAAYLGDDLTDEDAFEAINGRGLSVLVRREWRPGSAQTWLRPPVQLREFLTAWLQATQR